MEMKLVWSEKAILHVAKIQENHGTNIVTNIRIRTKILKNFPELGQKEPLLFDFKQGFRYLVEGHFKILYWIDNKKIRISSVFDTRQDPEKIKIID